VAGYSSSEGVLQQVVRGGRYAPIFEEQKTLFPRPNLSFRASKNLIDLKGLFTSLQRITMFTYITEHNRTDGRYAGPRIMADTWRDAEIRADELTVILVGELQFVTDENGTMLDSTHADN
jgi:hypothetical protein